MTRSQIRNFWNLAAQFFLGGIALSWVTLDFFWLQVDIASAAFDYLTVMVLVSVTGNFIASTLLAITSAAGRKENV
jgi:uncharacterized membrane protein YciS (DUF1049 family)